MRILAWLVGASVLGVLGVIVYWTRLGREADRHESWLRDLERRERQQGIDQVCIDWPIQKTSNELSGFNRFKLRELRTGTDR